MACDIDLRGARGRPIAGDQAPHPQATRQSGSASETERAAEPRGRRALTLVSAPAGFGKTTLLTEWLAATPADGSSAAWLSLDQRDNDPALFWTYVLAALQTAAPGVGAGALSLPHSPQQPIEAVLATLLNDLSALPNDVVLVLDDYHVIESRDVQDGMAFFLEHLPPQVHLVIASRADPALALARLRGRGELVEIRAADLRFTPDEAAAYLNEVMGLALTAGDVAALEERTEGWIAALQLAAGAITSPPRASATEIHRPSNHARRVVNPLIVDGVAAGGARVSLRQTLDGVGG